MARIQRGNSRPEPGPILDHRDPQKGRWGGASAREGREMLGVFKDADRRFFWFDLIVRSTDGSEIEPPAVFHLHTEQYAVPIQHIRRKQADGRSLIYSDVSATRAYTVGVQVKARDGRWISLEYDLAGLAELPRRFFGRRVASRPAVPVVRKEQMRILFLAANPLNTGRLALDEEMRDVENALMATRYRDAVSLEIGHAVRPDDLILHVRSYLPNVIHFSGHGGNRGITLADDRGGAKVVSGEQLRSFLFDRGIDLLVLNACYSARQAEATVGAVRAVVGTAAPVNDIPARKFAVAFYRSLGNGLSLKEALRDARDSAILNNFDDVFRSSGDLNFVPIRPG